ncbi:MAG: phosphatase [Opitutaceae bacterium]|nr:phosphatase [Cytophagales bacterium]
MAAVDIGSNAIRVHISNLLTTENKDEFKTLEYIRVPLRLGEDVFSIGEISAEKIDKLEKLAQSLIYLFEIFKVSNYLCCATSAMRESTNGLMVVNTIKSKTNFNIEIIDGAKEAELTNFGLQKYLSDGTWVHVDVGGGSTEINVFKHRVKTASKSFRIGAVRMLMNENIENEWKSLNDWLKNELKNEQNVTTIGTGGNIGKIHQMTGVNEADPISINQILVITGKISQYSTEDRIHILKLNPDRADVILPSSKIYLAVMGAIGSKIMYAPKIGLTDGMLASLKIRNNNGPNIQAIIT